MSLFSRLSAVAALLCAMLFAGAALACDYCEGGGAYGGRAVYSCNNGLYDCRTESSLYQPRCDDGCYRRTGCGDGCYHRRSSGCCEHSYVRGFRDGYETARYEGDDQRGEYDGDHAWHDYERWQDNNGGWHDGWRGGDGHWHDREARDDHQDAHDGEHHDGDHSDGDAHGGDGHDGHDGHDDHHDGDHHDHP